MCANWGGAMVWKLTPPRGVIDMALKKSTISGVGQTEKALKQLPKATAKGVLRRGLIKASAPTVAAAKAMTPRGPTGNLLASITVNARLVPNQKKGREKKGTVEVYIGASRPPGFHAHLLEFGTVKMPAQPFMRPAWAITRKKFMDRFEAEVWVALNKSAKTLAKKATSGKLSKTALKALS